MAESVAVTKIIEVDVKASANAAAHVKQLADGLAPIKDSAEKAAGGLSQMLSMVRGFVGFQILDMVGEKVLAVASALQEASDKSKVLEERMKLVTSGSGEAGRAFQAIVDISIRQGRELDAVAKLYEKVQRSSEQLALTQRGVAVITEGVAASLRLSGASTQEANAAMLQFAQALASGKLGGDEFRSLMENNSVLMQNFAKELGTTMGGLREMSKEGDANAGKLREAMLKVGEDGKNMMQRMIEQADKLPKTFEQAVTGAKSALVDLVNAMQQASDKSAGIWTGMVEKLTDSIRQAAALLRRQAIITAEIAKEMNKKIEEEMPETPWKAKIALDNPNAKRQSEERLEAAKKELEQYEKIFSNNPRMRESARWTMLTNQVKTATAEVRAYNKLIAEMAQQDSGDIQGGGFTTGAVQPGPEEKKKGKGPDTAVDVIERIRSKLEGDAIKYQAIIAGETKARGQLEDTLEEIDKVQAGKLSSTFIEAEKASLRRQQAFNEELKREADDILEGPKRIAARNQEVDKEYERYLREMKRIKEDSDKDRLTQDPFIGAEAEVARLKELMFSEWTGNDQEKIDMIVKRISEVRAKAALQLLGQKSPMKSVASQMADSFESAFDRMTTDLLDFNKSTKDIFTDMVTSILKDFARIQIKQQTQPLMAEGASWIGKIIEGYFGTGGSSDIASAMGTVWDKGVQMFANGGVVNGPTGFAHAGGMGVMGESGAEAIMPLKRGANGKLGVEATPVTVNVFNNTKNAKASTNETTNSKGEREINVIVEEMVESSLGSGRYDNVLGNSFGISRKGR